MRRTWEDNAAEFGALTKQGYGVRLAVLAACSCENRQGATSPSSEKSSIEKFATAAGVSPSTVSSYLNKWDRMIEGGWSPARAALTPEDAETLDLPAKFIAEFDLLPTAGKKDSPLTGKAADIAKNTRAMAEAIIADVGVAKAAAAALKESKHPVVGKPPTTAEGNKVRQEVAATNDAEQRITIKVFEAASLLQQVQRDWDGYIGDVPGVANLRRVSDALHECRVIAESLHANLELDQLAGVVRS